MLNFPSEKRKCHRCNFEKSCRELVISEACQRWVKIPWTQHPLTGEKIDDYGCIDDHAFMQMIDLQRQTSLVTAEINVLRNEVAKAHTEQLTMASIAVQKSQQAVFDAINTSSSIYYANPPQKLLPSSVEPTHGDQTEL